MTRRQLGSGEEEGIFVNFFFVGFIGEVVSGWLVFTYIYIIDIMKQKRRRGDGEESVRLCTCAALKEHGRLEQGKSKVEEDHEEKGWYINLEGNQVEYK